MQNIIEAPKAPAKGPAPEGSWIQITFTLDPGHYKALWQRAEKERRTLSSLVRENTIDFLNETSIAAQK